MRIADMNWMQVEVYLKQDDRCIVPVGSTEQHAYLSLSTDNILAERVALEAAEPLHIAVFPVLNYGITPYFRAYPGSVNLRVTTFLAVIRDMLDSLAEQGFKRILIVNGHGGNSPAQALVQEWMGDNTQCTVQWHNWWNAPKTWAKVQAIDPVASHASWMENFPWTRLPGVSMPETQRPMTDAAKMRMLNPQQTRAYLEDGNFGGLYQRPDDDMLAIWAVAIAETRDLLTGDWG
ncbi:MAG TPA: creatininase family protein [Phototrophicaceae bacterium]|jgi:creatinine amidohydrolase|nr:creatininase family protein [Phototrophicaceae bacterium]